MPSLERVRFLIVDDNSHMIHIVETILRGFGAALISSARDAAEAFDKIKNDDVDIVICDYMMPVLDGLEFVKLLRTSSDITNHAVPVILLTAHTERSRVEAARDMGATEVCSKPVTAKELLRKVVAVVDFPRPFIRASGYVGPDRRRNTREYNGPERRSGLGKVRRSR
jgi:CheY-like chemotaxis protein